jgi:hypothetical protein
MADDTVRAVYGWRTTSRWLFLALVVVVSVSVVPLLFAVAVSGASPVAAVVLVLLGLGWLVLVGLSLWRLAQTIELTASQLRWRTPVRRGALALSDIRAIRPVPVMAVGGVHAIETLDGTAVWMLVSRGFTEFVDDVRQSAGAVEVRLSRAVGRVDRLPGRSQYRRR